MRFYLLLFFLNNVRIFLSDISPVVVAVPADCMTVEKAVRFLPNVNIVNRALCIFFEFRNQCFELLTEHCPLPEY